VVAHGAQTPGALQFAQGHRQQVQQVGCHGQSHALHHPCATLSMSGHPSHRVPTIGRRAQPVKPLSGGGGVRRGTVTALEHNHRI